MSTVTTKRTKNKSLDKTSHPGTPGPDELVPSRYAVRIGEIDVLVVSDGVLLLPTETLATNVDPVARAAWFEELVLPPEKFHLPLKGPVVRSGDRTILVDS